MLLLSDRAERYLRRCRWTESLRDRDQIISLLDGQGWPTDEAILQFQIRYGGLVISEASELTLSLMRTCVHEDGSRHYELLRCFEIGGETFVECAEDHFATPSHYVIDRQGMIYSCVPSYQPKGRQDLKRLGQSVEDWIEKLLPAKAR